MKDDTLPIAIYYEHPDWFRPLFAELDRRGVPYARVDASRHCYDPGASAGDYALVFNRMSASAYLRGHANALFYARDYLAHLERKGVRVVNGAAAFAVETSKARQLAVFDSLGLAYPRTRVFNSPEGATRAARGLRFPVVVKPNVGGRGAGVVRYDTPESLARAARDERIDFGADGSALAQEFLPARGGYITRVETLAGRYLYAIRVYPTGESFNLCPAEFCQTDGAPAAEGGAVPGGVAAGEMCLSDAPKTGLRVEPCEPPREIVEAVERIARAAGLDLGGVEYLVDERDGRACFYDINALSNFVADAPRLLGFDPHARLVDYLEEEVRKCATDTGSRSSAAG